MSSTYAYIGSNPPFTPGDKVIIKPGHTFLIEWELEKGHIKYDQEYTFVDFHLYGFGNNYCILEESLFTVPECALERV